MRKGGAYRDRFGAPYLGIHRADLQTTLKTSDVVALAPGQLLNLGVPTLEDVNIRVGQLAKFKGRLAASGDRAAVQITRSAIPAEEEQS